ncbi:MAG: NAD-dependent epimerase/dehydratase family protein [Thermoanaerobaculales bacterium]|jgi:nucleoside-diphosphate-sugar epimerase|nr:NAD-dependent epimerase/dehydratase family protein [Thermoanaerobaculales bacterium]
MRCLVTGGGGFLGGAIVRRLVERGDEVRTLQRGDYPALAALGVECVRGDIADPSAVDRAVTGCDLVFHVAAKVEMWGPRGPFHRANVVGTANLLDAMRRHGVGRLVFTSSPSVVHGGADIAGGDESLPYRDRYEAHYPATKAEAERLVLAANRPELATVALRPHLVWGPRDRNLVPKIVERARAGQLRLVGDGSNLIDTVYIDNAVDAHLAAAERLAPGASCAGRPYFISNGDPRPVKEIVNGFVTAAGLEPVSARLPVAVAVAAGHLFETLHRLLPRTGEPRMTPFLARNLATAHWYDISAARRDLGYEPRVGIDEGMGRLRAWFEEGAPV